MIVARKDFLPEDVYDFLGHKVGIRSNSREVLAHLRSMYGRFYLGCDDLSASKQNGLGDTSRLKIQVVDDLASSNELLVNDNFYLYRLSNTDHHCSVTCKDLKTLASEAIRVCDPLTFIQGVILRTVSLLAKDHHLIHAGAVSWNEEGIIFPAASNMGKSTLALKLTSHGFKFLSDEVACLNGDLDIVEPFPRKVNIRHGSRELLGLPLGPNTDSFLQETEEWEQTLDIEDIAPGSLSNPCAPRYILFLQGFGERPMLERISNSEGLFGLFNFSISPIADPALVVFKFASLFDKIQCLNLLMGDLDETAELLMGLLERGSAK